MHICHVFSYIVISWIFTCIFHVTGFARKEFRGKLAIAITANFVNRNTTAEAKVEEISGVAFIFNQKFFLELKEETGEFGPNAEAKRISQHASSALSLPLGGPLLSEYAPVFRHRLGEHSILQRQYALFCHDSEETESAGQRGHHKSESTNMVSMYVVSITSVGRTQLETELNVQYLVLNYFKLHIFQGGSF